MKHIAYILGIFFFSPSLYANIQGKFDTSFSINKPASLPPNPWILAIIGYTQPHYSIGTPKIICNFRNIPAANLFVGATSLHSAWLLNHKYSPSKISPFVKGKQNYSSFLHEKSLFTHHRISFVENYFQQEHSIEVQLPISRKTSIFTGIGIIHTNQYGFKNSPVYDPINTPSKPSNLPVIGKIQVIKTLPNSWSFISNLTFTTSTFNHDGKHPSTPITHPNLNQHQGTLSLIENYGIPWHYSSMWNWNLQSAILVAGHTVKIPCLLRASIGNTGSIVGFSTWLPIQLSYLKQIEITYLSGESPLLIGFIGRTAYLRNKTNKNSFQWKASFLWNNNIGIMPQITFLFNS
jgi:hypothetical protein